MNISENIKTTLSILPSDPGVYQFFDANGKIIYVGKAKSLKKRVSSYFQKEHDNRKLEVLVSKIIEIRYIVVGSEQEALLLENNLIKKYQPRYNVLLKDDKTFPWICIRNEPFPRIYLTRQYINDGSIYFGPYTSLVIVKTLLGLIRELYPLRTCKLDLNPEKILLQKYSSCLEYHIGRCKAPCIGLQSINDYNGNINQIKHILKGNISVVIVHLKELIHQYSTAYQFEEAHIVKEKLTAIEKFRSKSLVVNPSIHDVDVFSIVEKDEVFFVNFLKIIDGCIVQVHTIELRQKLDEGKEELLRLAIVDIRERLQSHSPEIVVPFDVELEMKGVVLTVPKIGDKLKLLELSERNARFFASEAMLIETKIKPKSSDAILVQMKKDLRLKQLPRIMECFDNSNLQGTNPVASCVVFKNAKPFKSAYRHFNIRTVEGPNDFASMEEILFRRYKRLLDENSPLPNLIVVDGGKGQLSAALKSLEKLGIVEKVEIIGIAKKLEEIFIPGDSTPLYIDKHSHTLKIIQHLRNEAHRFGITFHKQKRSNDMIASELDEIKGIGEKNKEVLLKKFRSVEKIRDLKIEDLEECIGKAKGKIVFDHFQKNSL